jgi:hypothetical protein
VVAHRHSMAAAGSGGRGGWQQGPAAAGGDRGGVARSKRGERRGHDGAHQG